MMMDELPNVLELPTLAEALRAQGLRTAGFSANPWITPEFQFDRGFDSFVSQHAVGFEEFADYLRREVTVEWAAVPRSVCRKGC